MGGLRLLIHSFADMTTERARRVGLAYDAHPQLRPHKVGGDPARIKVEQSMEAVIAKTGLPIDWLTVRGDVDDDTYESGQISLYPGRGGAIGTEDAQKEMNYLLVGNHIEHRWNATTMSQSCALQEAVGLLIDLAQAMDASYGYLDADPSPVSRENPSPTPTSGLQGVFWLNYYGRAIVEAKPALRSLPFAQAAGEHALLVQTATSPWESPDSHPSADVTTVRTLFGEAAFRFRQSNRALPGVEQHLAASPGPMEMPWVAWERDKDLARRGRRYRAARRRLEQATALAGTRQLGASAVEWSTSLDTSDWEAFTKHLSRRLRGDFTSPLGKAAVAVAQLAPLDEEDSVLLDTVHGTVRFGWSTSDLDVVDVTVHGSPPVVEVCGAWFEPS
ncbi:hypothetical protein SAMN06264364_10941 [Quadrisphaera granulorum]|uniref:Uncharacterized protein n=1 Tax=Quadrisphaera granulorum TaxID=317664 RepID=A0A316AAD0_9ACTN|nr:hypothetical protein [Quadrisphaera granulorum]PWJ53960.1 hypothetical protein BXY45_10941 [Quadrisphaera granulorum]SZE96417.1 hypothetical protein SAMN06264364_10941 [Quadrisphaera granulorum]